MCRVGIDVATREDAVSHFRRNIAGQTGYLEMVREELAGKDLACWCPLDQPCHADVLLEIANPEMGTHFMEHIGLEVEEALSRAFQAGSQPAMRHNSILAGEELTAKIEQIIAGGT